MMLLTGRIVCVLFECCFPLIFGCFAEVVVDVVCLLPWSWWGRICEVGLLKLLKLGGFNVALRSVVFAGSCVVCVGLTYVDWSSWC